MGALIYWIGVIGMLILTYLSLSKDKDALMAELTYKGAFWFSILVLGLTSWIGILVWIFSHSHENR